MMRDLKISHLRIGNWLLGKKPVKVDEIQSPDHVGIEGNESLFLIDGANGCLDPIPLTEEILLKAGFENWGLVETNINEHYRRFVMFNILDGTSNFEVHFITSNYGGDTHKEICFSIDKHERQHVAHTEHVHNMQNCFFQITGTELEINL